MSAVQFHIARWKEKEGQLKSFLANFEFCKSANYEERYGQKYTAVSNLLITFLLVDGSSKFKDCQKAPKELLITASINLTSASSPGYQGYTTIDTLPRGIKKLRSFLTYSYLDSDCLPFAHLCWFDQVLQGICGSGNLFRGWGSEFHLGITPESLETRGCSWREGKLYNYSCLSVLKYGMIA